MFSRTKQLNEKILKLEAKIRELEREIVWWKHKALNFKKYHNN